MATPAEVLDTAAGGPAAPVSDESRRRLHPALAASAAGVAALAVVPAVYLAWRAVRSGDLVDTLLQAGIPGLLVRTTLLVTAVTATTLAIAVPLAWLTLRTDLPARRVWVVVSALPLVIPSFVGGYAFAAAFGPRGLLQGWLAPLGVERLPTIYGFPGAWLVLSLFTYPLVLLPVRAAMAGIDPSLTDAARTLGRSSGQAFLRVTLPQLRPAMVAGGLLVALYTLSDFGAVSLMRFESLTVEALIRYRTFDRGGAAVIGLVTVIFTVTVLALEIRTRRRGIYHPTHRGVRRRPKPVALGPWRWPALACCAALVTLALVVPVGVIAIWLIRAMSVGTALGGTLAPAARSIEASLVGALAVVVCAWPIAVVAARHRSRFARGVEAASYIGYAMPAIVLAISLVSLTVATPLYQTLACLVLAYVVHFLPQATGTLRASVAQIHPGLEEAARSLGASPLGVLHRLTFPLVRPGLLTAFALVFLTVMKELPATLLLAPPEFETLATEVWDAASAASFGRAALPALALVVLSSAPMAILVTREQRHLSR